MKNSSVLYCATVRSVVAYALYCRPVDRSVIAMSVGETTAFGVTYKFKMDGKDYPDSMGGTAAWKAVDANTWEVVAKATVK